MKARVILIAVLVSALLAMSSVFGIASALDDILARGKLIVGTDLTNPPWEYRDPNTGEATGFAIELARMYAEALGVELEVKDYDWSALLPALVAKKIDMFAANLSRTVARSTKILYCDAYVIAPGVAVAKAGKFESLEEVNSPDVLVNTTTGSIFVDVAEQLFPEAELITVPTGAEQLAGLLGNRYDVTLTGKFQALDWMKARPELEILPGYLMMDSFAFAVPYDSFKLWSSFNVFLRMIKLDGQFGKLYEEWFGAEWDPVVIEHGI